MNTLPKQSFKELKIIILGKVCSQTILKTNVIKTIFTKICGTLFYFRENPWHDWDAGWVGMTLAYICIKLLVVIRIISLCLDRKKEACWRYRNGCDMDFASTCYRHSHSLELELVKKAFIVIVFAYNEIWSTAPVVPRGTTYITTTTQ